MTATRMRLSPAPSIVPPGRTRRITQNLLALFGSELFSRLLTWVTILYLNRHWASVALYGQYATAVNWYTLFIAFSDLGFSVLTIREVAHRKERTEFFLRNVMALKLAFSALFFAALIAISGAFHYEAVLRAALAVIGCRLFLDAVSAAYIYILQGHELMLYQGVVTTAGAFLRMAGTIAVVWAGGGLVGVCWIWVAEGALSTLALSAIGLGKGWKPCWPRLRLGEATGVLVAALPLAAFGTFQMLYNRVDAIILKSLSGNEAVAFYDVASRLLFVVLLPSNLVSLALLPVLSSLQDDPAAFGRTAARGIKALVFLGAPLTAGGILLGRPLITALIDARYAASGTAFSVLALYILLYNVIRTPVSLLSIRRPSLLIWIYSFLFVLNVAMNFVFIPRWGLMGAAYATVACGLVELVLVLGSVRSMVRIPSRSAYAGRLLAGLAASAIMGAGIWFDRRLYWLALGPLIYAAALALLRGFDSDDWASLRAALGRSRL